MPKEPKKLPPVRIGPEGHMEIDLKKGEWPFLAIRRDDKGRVELMLDLNPASGVGETQKLRLSLKKSRALTEYLIMTDPETEFMDPDEDD